jgi:hypothetical protein
MTTLQKIKYNWESRLCAVLNGIERTSRRLRLNIEDGLIPCSREEKMVLEKNAELRERHHGQPCFVIGNGPSLNQQDLRPLAGSITFAMSGFWKHPIVQEWQPTYYCLADPIFFDGSEAMARFLLEMSQRITKSTYLLPLECRSEVRNKGLLRESAYYLNFRGGLYKLFARRLDLTSAVPRVESVSQMAIMSAIYMGCSPVYLIGLDHDWLARRGAEGHFYAGKTVEGHPIAHGDLNRVPYKADLASALRLWDGYEKLQQIAAAHQVEIFNASHGGYLDVFPRKTYDEILRAHLSNNRTPSSAPRK